MWGDCLSHSLLVCWHINSSRRLLIVVTFCFGHCIFIPHMLVRKKMLRMAMAKPRIAHVSSWYEYKSPDFISTFGRGYTTGFLAYCSCLAHTIYTSTFASSLQLCEYHPKKFLHLLFIEAWFSVLFSGHSKVRTWRWSSNWPQKVIIYLVCSEKIWSSFLIWQILFYFVHKRNRSLKPARYNSAAVRGSHQRVKTAASMRLKRYMTVFPPRSPLRSSSG